jgi:hypothetical protein
MAFRTSSLLPGIARSVLLRFERWDGGKTSGTGSSLNSGFGSLSLERLARFLLFDPVRSSCFEEDREG